MSTQFVTVDASWPRTPDDLSLLDPESWKTATKNRFGALRKTFLVVEKKSLDTINGPILLTRTLPAGTDVKYERKVSLVTKRIDTILISVQKTISSKLASELSTKLNAELGLFPVPGSAKISTEAQSKISTEFTEALSTQVTDSRSFEVSNLEEFTSSITLKLPGKESPPLKYYFFLPVYTCCWEIYLYRQETLEFTYGNKLWFWKERKNEKYGSEDLRVPLARLTFYEPADDFPSLQLDGFKPDVADGTKILVEPLTEPCPSTIYKEKTSLRELAAAAFPVSKEEEKIHRAVHSKLPKKKSREDQIAEKLTTRPSRKFGKKMLAASEKPVRARKSATKSRHDYASHKPGNASRKRH